MRIIDAVWEKRNLGVSCKEIVFDESDTLSTLKSIAPEIEDIEYVVAKVPPGRFDLISALHEQGFIFIEAALGVTHDLKNTEPAGIMNRINKEISHTEMNDEDSTVLYSEIRKNLFETDRIYIDPVFSREKAAERYVNWIKDEVNRGAELFNIVYKGKKIGFFIYKELENKICYPFLASLYTDYKTSGLGFSVIQKPIEEAKKRNCKSISTIISSNNMPILKLHMSLGFRPDKITNVLVKHSNQKQE